MRKLTLCFSLMCSMTWAQHPSGTDSSRFFNLGIKVGPAYESAEPSDNPYGIYASDRPLLDLTSFNLALEAQFYRVNSFGISLEAGYRKNSGGSAEDNKTRAFNGGLNGEFPRSSLYLRPGLIYNHTLGEYWMILGTAGIEVHSNINGESAYFYKSRYRLDVMDIYTLLSLGVEFKTWLSPGVGLSFYTNLTHGWNGAAELYYTDLPGSGDYTKIGEYRGSGINFGVKLSACFFCLN